MEKTPILDYLYLQMYIQNIKLRNAGNPDPSRATKQNLRSENCRLGFTESVI